MTTAHDDSMFVEMSIYHSDDVCPPSTPDTRATKRFYFLLFVAGLAGGEKPGKRK